MRYGGVHCQQANRTPPPHLFPPVSSQRGCFNGEPLLCVPAGWFSREPPHRESRWSAPFHKAELHMRNTQWKHCLFHDDSTSLKAHWNTNQQDLITIFNTSPAWQWMSSSTRDFRAFKSKAVSHSPKDFTFLLTPQTRNHGVFVIHPEYSALFWDKASFKSHAFISIQCAHKGGLLLTTFPIKGPFMSKEEPNFISLGSIALQKVQHTLIISYGALWKIQRSIYFHPCTFHTTLAG